MIAAMPNFRPFRAIDSFSLGRAMPRMGTQAGELSAPPQFPSASEARTAVAYYLNLQERAALRHSRPKSSMPSRHNPFMSLTHSRTHDPVGHPNAARGDRSRP